MITIIFRVLNLALQLYVWALILSALFSVLTSFNVLDTRNRFVWSVGEFLYRITDPLLRPIRRVLPSMSGIDLSPWIAVLVLRYVAAPLLAALYEAVISGSWQPLVL